MSAVLPPTGMSAVSLRATYVKWIGAIVALALLVVSIMDAYTLYREASEKTRLEQVAKLETAEAHISRSLERVENVTREAFRVIAALETVDETAIRIELHRLLKVLPEVESVAFFPGLPGEQAQRFGAARRELDSQALAGIDAAAIAAWKRLGEWRIGPIAEVDGYRPHLLLCHCPADDGPRGVLRLDLRFLGDVVSEARQPRGESIYVVDPAGTVLAHTDHSVTLSKPRWKAPAPEVPAGPTLDDRLRTYRGAGLTVPDAFLGAMILPRFGWLVVSEVPASVVTGPARNVVLRGLLYAMVLLAGLFMVITWLAKRLAEPVAALENASRKMAAGDLSTRVAIGGSRELESLGRSINHMAGQLEDYTRGLEAKVAEKTAELERANRHKSEFLANMSHELRTPLNAVIGFSDALRAQYFGELNPKQLQYAQDIHHSGQLLLSLINDLLDLSKIESGKMELDASRFALADTVEGALVFIRERAAKSGVTVTAEFDPTIGEIVADERKLRQILINLLTNAVKFTPAEGRIRVNATRAAQGGVSIAVTDTGPGIDPKDHERIFEAFQQLPSSGSAKHEGTGLGLALVKRMVELHGGTIRVESTRGEGATFVFELPHAFTATPGKSEGGGEDEAAA